MMRSAGPVLRARLERRLQMRWSLTIRGSNDWLKFHRSHAPLRGFKRCILKIAAMTRDGFHTSCAVKLFLDNRSVVPSAFASSSQEQFAYPANDKDPTPISVCTIASDLLCATLGNASSQTGASTAP